MNNSHDTIGKRTRDLPACSAVSEPTVPPRTPICVLPSFLPKISVASSGPAVTASIGAMRRVQDTVLYSYTDGS